jgi:hypothetical protein
MSSANYHEPAPELSSESRQTHRALASLVEELEAIDWYQQRIDVVEDDQLRAILAHNRDEEIEHASMLLEWLRRNQPGFDENLKTYLFTSGPIARIEETVSGEPLAGDNGGSAPDDLGVGNFTKEQ